jgi:hypothetical protein
MHVNASICTFTRARNRNSCSSSTFVDLRGGVPELAEPLRVLEITLLLAGILLFAVISSVVSRFSPLKPLVQHGAVFVRRSAIQNDPSVEGQLSARMP